MSNHPQWDEDFYRLLGVARSANLSEIATAYHQAKSAYSKDSPATYSLFTPEENQATLAKLEKAYLTLSNIDKKRDYDRWLDNESQIPGGNERSNIAPSRNESVPHPFAGQPFNGQPTDMPTFFQNAMRPDAESPGRVPTQSMHHQSMHTAALSPVTDTAPTSSADTTAAPEAAAPTMGSGLMDGTQLKQIREKLGLTADDVCRITKIPSRFLKAIESAKVADLPARVYLQGFVKNLAKLYHLDPKTTVEAYLQTVTPPPPPTL